MAYRKVAALIVTIGIMFAFVGVPLSEKPAVAAKVDVVVLGLLFAGVCCMKPGSHGFNALIFGAAGLEAAWLLARRFKIKPLSNQIGSWKLG
jgi:hypothetical protein